VLFSYLRNALRNIERERLNAAVAVIGLGIGIMAALLLASYCMYYHGYDRQLPDSDQWYRLRLDVRDANGNEHRTATFYTDPAPLMLGEIKEVTEYSCFWYININFNLRYNDRPVQFDKTCFASKDLVKNLGLKIVYGNPDSVFCQQGCVLFSASCAEGIFGPGNPVGKHLLLPNGRGLTITGVFADLPANMHLRSDVFRCQALYPDLKEANYRSAGHVRVKIPNPKDVPVVERRLNEMFRANPLFGVHNSTCVVHIDPLSRIHFMPGLEDDERTTDPRTIVTVEILAGLIMLASLLNFINLLALSWRKRTDEFAFRRAMGASSSDLFVQLYTEHAVWFLFSATIGVVLALSLSGLFARIVALPLGEYSALRPELLPVVLGMLLLVGIVSGILSALRFVHSSPANDEQRYYSRQTGNRVILFAQIVISAVFIVSALVVSAQMRLIRHRDLGFNAANQVEYHYNTANMPGAYQSPQSVLDTLSMIPGVLGVTGSSFSIAANPSAVGQSTHNITYTLPGPTPRRAEARNAYFLDGFCEKQGLIVKSGRLPETGSFGETAVNEQFVRKYLSGTNPLGQAMQYYYAERDSVGTVTIVGVLSDAWFAPAYTPLQPTVFSATSRGAGEFQIRYDPTRKAEVLSKVERTFAEMSRPYFFGYRSHDVMATIRGFYAEDETTNRMIVFFALVVAFISASGVYSVSSLHIRRQMKEIAIRKVCGAELRDLIAVFARPYLLILGAGGAVGLVLSHYLTLLFLDRYTVRLVYTWLWYALGLAILAVLVIVPLLLNIRRGWKADPNEYLQSE
jgi:putative ABC transport system permease protein